MIMQQIKESSKLVKFRPLQDYVLVKPIERSRSHVLTVITSETDQGSIGSLAEVVAVGPGKHSKRGKLIPLDCQIGQRVIYGGERLGCINFPKVVENGTEFRLIQEADIVGITKEAA